MRSVRSERFIIDSATVAVDGIDDMFVSTETSAMAVRVILAALVSISLAMVPAVGGVDLTKSTTMAVTDQADMPCCNSSDDCKTPAACTLKCFNFIGAIAAPMVPLPCVLEKTQISFVPDALREHLNSPPTRPPPV